MESISSRLQSLFNELELVDHPRRDPIRVVLQTCITDTRATEANFGFADLVKENEALKKELEAVQSNSASQINILRSELDALREEQTKADENQETLPGDQFAILCLLPVFNQGDWPLDRVSERAKVAQGDAEVHLQALLERDMVSATQDATFFRTIGGTKYIMQWRQAFERDTSRKMTYCDFSGEWESILMALRDNPGGLSLSELKETLRHDGISSISDAVHVLDSNNLCKLEFDGIDYSASNSVILREGIEYLAERGKL